MCHTNTATDSDSNIRTLPRALPRSQRSYLSQRVVHTLFLVLSLNALFVTHAAIADQRRMVEDSPGQSNTGRGGTLILSNATSRVEAVQLDADMNVVVSGLLAQMTLSQTFRNTSSDWMQARYLFPLPENAAVQALMMETNGKIIHGKIMPRSDARKSFDAARDSGQVAGLVEQQRPNLFTMDVATVAPDSELHVTLTLMLPVDVDSTSRSMTLPTTHTPRYINRQTPQPQAVSGAFTKNTQQRGPRLNLQVSIEGLTDYTSISSDSHVLRIEESAAILSDVPMDRDVFIRWPAPYTDSASSQVFFSEHDQERYAQILLNPPRATATPSTARRELVIVVDKSGSMAGESMQAARTALEFALDSIHPDDYFNIIAFNDQSYPLFRQSQIANKDNLQQAQSFVQALNADGGTEMRESLQLALRSPSPADVDVDSRDSRLKQIVFLTDGSVGYEDAMLLEIKQSLGNSRLFTIGIGSAPNQWFLRKAAEVGRGVALSIPDSQSAANAIEQLLTKLASPVVTDIDVQFMGGHGELYPDPVPDLYADKPQMLVGQLGPDVTQIILSGKQQVDGESQRWQQRLSIEPLQPVHESTDVPVAKLFWTRLKVASLLDEQRFSADDELHRQTITQLALNAQLLTPYTSFVAIEQKAVAPIDATMQTAEVASLIPHGNTMLDLVMPQGAAGMDTLAWLSLLLASIGIVLIHLSRRSQHGMVAVGR